ncbi:MAG: site-specific integrase, partial [Aureliella sp.]
YARSIKYACIRAKLPHWFPNQLRHSAATEIRQVHGLEAASITLGHSSLVVTQTYAEEDQRKAIAVAMTR